MPWTIKKGKDGRPWKIVKKSGKVVGSSSNKNDAMASIRARYESEAGYKMHNA